jgi:hypothetical protein
MLILRKQDIRERRGKMENFVLVGKAKTVFQLIALKAQQEELAKLKKKYQKGRKQ